MYSRYLYRVDDFSGPREVFYNNALNTVEHLLDESNEMDSRDVYDTLSNMIDEYYVDINRNITRMNDIIEQLSNILASNDITVTPAMEGNSLTIGNYGNMDESRVQELTNNVRDLDLRLRIINNEIVSGLTNLNVWHHFSITDPRLREWGYNNLRNHFISERVQDNLNITITRREYLFRRYRFLVISRLLPDLAIRYVYFNLLDL